MKNIIIVLFAFFFLSVNARNYTRKGTVFTQTTETTAQVTKFTFTDSKGINYPIYITKTGRCYIKKVSSKTGKEYKSYLKEDLCKEVCKELKIAYVPAKK